MPDFPPGDRDLCPGCGSSRLEPLAPTLSGWCACGDCGRLWPLDEVRKGARRTGPQEPNAMEPARRYPRADVSFDIDVVSYSAGVSQRDTARLVVLSAGGAFLELDGNYAVGSILKVGFALPSMTEPMTGLAIVRDQLSGKGVGVEFLDLEPRDRERITAFVNRHLAGDPGSSPTS